MDSRILPSSKTSTPLLTVEELAQLIKKSQSSVHKLWPEWVSKYGLRPVRFGGRAKGRLLFPMPDVERMIEQWRIAP